MFFIFESIAIGTLIVLKCIQYDDALIIHGDRAPWFRKCKIARFCNNNNSMLAFQREPFCRNFRPGQTSPTRGHKCGPFEIPPLSPIADPARSSSPSLAPFRVGAQRVIALRSIRNCVPVVTPRTCFLR